MQKKISPSKRTGLRGPVRQTALSLAFLFHFFFSLASSAEIYIKTGEAKTKKSQMAFPALQYFGSPNQSNFARVGAEMYNTIYNDLSVSSLFLMMDSKAFLEDPSKTALTPAPSPANGFQFQNWSSIGADFLIRAGFSLAGDEVTLETYTYQVSQARLIFGKKYKSSISQSRKMAHTFVNEVMEALTGVPGPFLGKFVVATDRGGGSSREIFTMDWDGASPQQISNHRSITISPAWSPDSRKIAYTAYVIRAGTKERNANLVLHDVLTGKKVLISYRKGMNSGASFDPDGKHIYLTISQGKSPDIYKMTLDGTIVKTITKGPNGAMNVEPNISKDGNKLVFSSDRAGRPMIYTSDENGDGAIRRTFEGTFNSSPVWSPDGKKIAFSGQTGSNFDIFVMDADGKNIKRITSAKKSNGKYSSNEDPSFSPDGRFLVYTSNRTGSNQIFISNIEGTEERRVTDDRYNYYKPRWSNNQ